MEKSVHAIVPKGNMGYDQYTVPDTVAVEPTFATFLQHYSKHMSMASRVIILISVKRTENHPQYLSGLSRELFPTTILEIALSVKHLFLLGKRTHRHSFPIKRL